MKKKNAFSNTLTTLAVVLVETGLVVACLGSYAWFYNTRKTYTYAHVQRPSTLAIKGPNQTTIERIDLSKVDLQNENRTANFVFCIAGTNTNTYKIELAYTTNVPFQYEILPTTQHEGTPSDDSDNKCLTYTDDTTGEHFYYNTDQEALTGDFINKTTDGNDHTIAVTGGGPDDKHQEAYEDYDEGNVQIHAEPVYYLITDLTPGTVVDSKFADYYILRLTWNEDTVTQYIKETDLVYLLAANQI